MQELTAAHIEIIISEVSCAGITFSHLREELIDHYCCDIESLMQQGISFENAFEKVKKIISTKGLKKIQENTLLLIDKRYRLMKNIMKIFGMISMVLITVGALFKIQHWPGAGIMLVLGFLLLGGVFMPSALSLLKKESKIKGSVFIYIAGIIGSSILLLGILFKIQHYPGAGILLLFGFIFINAVLIPTILISRMMDKEAAHLRPAYIVGAVSLICCLFGLLFKIQHYPGSGPLMILGAVCLTSVFLPLYAKKAYGKAENIKAGFIFLCIGIIFFNMFNLLLSLTVSKDVLGYYVKPGEEINLTKNILEKKNNQLYSEMLADSSMYDSLIFPEIKKIKNSSDEVCKFIEDIKVSIISMTDAVNQDEALKRAQNPGDIVGKDNYDVPTYIMTGNTDDGKGGKATRLRLKLNLLKKEFILSCVGDNDAITLINKALNGDSLIYDKYDGLSYTWEMIHFYHLITISVMNKLSCFQRDVRIAELQTLEHLEGCKVQVAEKKEIKSK